MLPPELLFLVCEGLEPRDILALSETCTANLTILSHLRTLFKLYPWYDRRFSSTKDSPWNVSKLTRFPKSFIHVPYPDTRYEEDLPSDFVALTGGCGRDEKYIWNICDQGLYFNSPAEEEEMEYDDSLDWNTHGIVDLRADKTAALPATPYAARLLPKLDLSGYKVKVLLEEEQNDRVSAVIMHLTDKKNFLLVKYGTEQVQKFELDSETFYHRLYLIGDMVIINKEDKKSKPLYLLPGLKSLTTLEDEPTAEYQGWMMYNGNLFKAVLDCKDRLVVASPTVKIKQPKRPQRLYNIYQDERNPRYAMAYTRKDGIMAYVIDLEECEVSMLLDKEDVWLLGLSKGELGLWKYSPMSLYGRCNSQNKSELGDLVEIAIALPIDEFLDFHGHLYDFEVDDEGLNDEVMDGLLGVGG